MKNLSAQRVKEFQKLLKNAELDGYIAVSPLEMRYFTGLDLGDGEAVFLMTPRKAYCLTKEMIVAKMAPVQDFITVKACSGRYVGCGSGFGGQK